MIGQDILHASQLLKKGELVGIPTETVYGLAGNALSEITVSKIFEVKKRPVFDPLIIHIDTWDKIKNYASHIPDEFQALAKYFSPGPITYLLPKKNIIPSLVTSGSPMVAIRIPKHPITLELLRQLDFPLAAPSANPFGGISPTSALHVERMLGSAIPYILEGGVCQIGLESTILGIINQKVCVLRKGGVQIEDIESIIGPVDVQDTSTSNPQAPGMLESHYAPKKPFYVGCIPDLLEKYKGQKVGVLSYQKHYDESSIHYILSLSGDLSESAQRFFNGLHFLDQSSVDIIIGELVPDQGLGKAINDRLKRAAAKR